MNCQIMFYFFFVYHPNLVLASNFPIQTFFNQPNDTLIEGQLCEKADGNKCCKCTADCMRYKTCCIDYLWKNTTETDLGNYLNHFVQEAEKYTQHTCENLLPQIESRKYKTVAYAMVSTCVTNTNTADRNKCLNRTDRSFDANLPVFGSDNLLYRNMHCAKCNNAHDYRFVTIMAQCNTHPIPITIKQDVFRDFYACRFELNDTVHFKRCTSYLKQNRQCKQDNKYYKLCQSFLGLLPGYANYFCFLCNNPSYRVGDPLKFIDNVKCVDMGPGPVPYGWNVVISYGNVFVQKKGSSPSYDGALCQSDEKYDIIKRQCSPFTCAHGYEIVNSTCVLQIKKQQKIHASNPQFESCLFSQENKLYVQIYIRAFNLQNFTRQFALNLNATQDNFTIVYQNGNYVYLEKNASINRELYIQLQNSLSHFDANGKQTFYVAKKQIITEYYGFDVGRNFQYNKICSNPMITDFISSNFSKECIPIDLAANMSKHELSMWIEFNATKTNFRHSLCSLFHISSSCKLHAVTGNYYIDQNYTLIINATSTNHTYHTDEYVPLRTGVGICSRNISNNGNFEITTRKWLKTINKVNYYVSIAGTSISIICYLWILITYLSYREILTSPALNMVGLCFSLLLADVSFIVGVENNDHEGICRTFGVILHWSLLSVEMWMIIIAIDLMMKFTTINVGSDKINKKIFFRHLFLACLIPTVVIGTIISLDEYGVFDARYGDDGKCWIGNFHIRLAFYIVPAASGYTLFAVALVITTYHIHHSQKESKKVLRNKGRDVNILKIALKLVFILGITEGFGFVQITGTNLSEKQLIFNSVFSLLFAVFRSLRGLILWIIYICTDKVFKLYKETLMKQPKQNNSGTKSSNNFEIDKLN